MIVSSIFFTLQIIFRFSNKVSLTLYILIISFFFYGHFFNLINDFDFGTHIFHRYIIIPYLIIFLLPIFFILISKKSLENVNKIFSSISVILIIISCSNIIINSNLSEFSTNDFEKQDLFLNKKPDIYYIILDSYADNYTLQKHFKFDNSEFDKFLIEKGFQSSYPSYSNYPTTYLSLSSSLNLNYVNQLLDEDKNYFDVTSANRLIDKNYLMEILHSNNYFIINFDSGWGPTRNISSANMNLCSNNIDFISEFMISIAETSFAKPFYAKLFLSDHSDRIHCVLSTLPIIAEDIEKPIFVFAHLLLPHPPYVFDKYGNPTNIDSLKLSSNYVQNEKTLYLEQLQYTTSEMKKIVQQLISDNVIIVIQSDHGPPDSIFSINNPNSSDKDKLRNINYYYLPNSEQIIYDGITPVNSFRKIFKNYFSNELENQLQSLITKNVIKNNLSDDEIKKARDLLLKLGYI